MVKTTTSTATAAVTPAGQPPIPVGFWPTKRTPIWARTTSGIVRRWCWPHVKESTLKILGLNERLLRLFAVACCRSPRVWDIYDAEARTFIDLLEHFADGGVSQETMEEAQKRIFAKIRLPDEQDEGLELYSSDHATIAPYLAGKPQFLFDPLTIAVAVFNCSWHVRTAASKGMLNERHVKFIVGIPFSIDDDLELDPSCDAIRSRMRLMDVGLKRERTYQGRLLASIAAPDWHLAEEWCTDTAVQLARSMYADREFSAMPILADALQAAGCNNEEWLARMRNPSWPWCRGCHVIDTLLPDLVR